jgi:methyltransferase (TIGR00027 family)
MKNKSAPITTTAFRVMFYVALEQYQPVKQRLIEDSLSHQMLPGGMRLLVNILGFSAFRQIFFSMIDHSSPGMRAGFCRKRYIDDKLIDALSTGMDSVVILGSGLDTRPYRLPKLSALPVYEVDLPQTIAYKQSRLQQLFGSIPPHVRLVPIDFAQQNLADGLKNYGYSTDQRSFFIWEGVTQYISATAVGSVFEVLAKVKPGSRMVFTYILKDFIDGKNTYGLLQLYQQTRVKNQIWQFGMQPSQIAAFIGAYSWKEIEQVGAEELRQRYLIPVGRKDIIMEIERTVYAEKLAN